MPLTGNGFCQFYAPHNVYHPGVDLNKGYGNQDCGNPVYAAKDGIVEFVNNEESEGHGFGIFLILRHPDGNYTRYAHLHVVEPLKVGDRVTEGQHMGLLGRTGPTTYCHLHFEVFNEMLAYFQRLHKHPWCFYPVGKSEAWVREHYLNPFEWLKIQTLIPEWAEIAVEKAKESGVITDWSNPYEAVGNRRLEWALEKAGLLNPAKHENCVTLVRLAVVLDKLGKLEKP